MSHINFQDTVGYNASALAAAAAAAATPQAKAQADALTRVFHDIHREGTEPKRAKDFSAPTPSFSSDVIQRNPLWEQCCVAAEAMVRIEEKVTDCREPLTEVQLKRVYEAASAQFRVTMNAHQSLVNHHVVKARVFGTPVPPEMAIFVQSIPANPAATNILESHYIYLRNNQPSGEYRLLMNSPENKEHLNHYGRFTAEEFAAGKSGEAELVPYVWFSFIRRGALFLQLSDFFAVAPKCMRVILCYDPHMEPSMVTGDVSMLTKEDIRVRYDFIRNTCKQPLRLDVFVQISKPVPLQAIPVFTQGVGKILKPRQMKTELYSNYHPIPCSRTQRAKNVRSFIQKPSQEAAAADLATAASAAHG